MARVMWSMSVWLLGSALCVLATSSPAAGQGAAAQTRPAVAAGAPQVRIIRRLNTSRRFYGPVTTPEAVRRMMARRNMTADIEAVLRDAGVGQLAGDVTRILSAATPTQLRDVSVPRGRRMEWMAQRIRGRADLMRTVEWGGAAAFAAFEFFIDDGARGYTFVLPKVCGNLTLVSVGPSPRAEAAEAARRAEEARRADDARRAEEAKAAEGRAAAEAARKSDEARRVEEARKAEESKRAAAEEARRAEETRRAEEARKAEEARQAAEAERERRAHVDWFVGALGGKERRVREMTPGVINGRCAPLVGFKIGPDVRLGNGGWRLAPSIGVAVNARDGEHTSLFGEAELNYWINEKGFVGTGAGVWDVTHSDTVAGTLLVQGGRELVRTANDIRLLVGEGRLFFDQLDDIDNNYQAWAGLRVVFR